MTLLTKIGGLISGGLVKDVGDVLTNFIPTPEKRAEAKSMILEIAQKYDTMIQEQVSSRHATDMNSDSWLSKNIRPMSLIFLVLVISILAFFDGNIGNFTIEKDYILLYKSLLLMTFTFYFGSRGAEKIIESINKNKRKDEPS